MNRYPKLRDRLAIRKVAEGDDVAYTVCDSARDKYFRIDIYTYLVAIHLDGQRSLAEVSRLCQEAMPYNDLSIPVVEEAVQDLNAIGLLEDPYSKNLLLLERAKARRVRVTDFFKNVLRWEIGMWDPDPFLDRTVGRVRWLFHPLPAFLVALGLIWSMWLVFVNRNRVSFDANHLLLGNGGLQGIGVLILILVVIGIIHELGHAYACKHFGASVHRMGAMLYYFGPCFFCDVSQSMLFENRWHRIWVAMGGIYFESFVTIAAAALWMLTPPELALNDIAYRVMMLGLIMGVLMNLNPLLKFDGYFVLSDLLQISDLRENALRYARDLLKRPFRRNREPLERVVGIRRRRAYVTYGLLTLLYTYSVIVCFFEWLRVTLVGAWSEYGFLVYAAMFGMFLRKPVGNVVAHAAGAVRRPSRSMIPWVVGAAFVLVLALFVRWPAHVSARSRIVSSGKEAVRAEAPGRVAAVLVREGDQVWPRQAVAILENDSVMAAETEARMRSGESGIELMRAVERSDPAGYQSSAYARQAALAEEASLGEARSRLLLAAREGGVVVTPRVRDQVGLRLEEGDTLLVLAREGSPGMECDLRQRDVGDIAPGRSFELRLFARPGHVLRGRVERIFAVPAPAPGLGPRFRVTGRLDSAPPWLRLGETGMVRIDIGSESLFDRIGRAWARLVRSDFWL